jgi:hypothetical protein
MKSFEETEQARATTAMPFDNNSAGWRIFRFRPLPGQGQASYYLSGNSAVKAH